MASRSVRTICIAVSVAAFAFACGSGSDSEFVDPNAGLDLEAGPPPGTFTPVDAGKADGSACKAVTCKDVNANCSNLPPSQAGMLPNTIITLMKHGEKRTR